MLIDCNDCVMQGTGACNDCIVTVLIGDGPLRPVELADEETEAIGNLADAGLVPGLRLVRKAGNQ